MRFAALALLLLATPAAAQSASDTPSASDTVRGFYADPAAASAWRDGDADALARFTDGALEALLAHNRLTAEDPLGCIDFDFVVSGQDYDAAELARTLSLEEQAGEEEATVWATFRQFDAPVFVEWWLRREDGVWKVADVSGIGWSLNDLGCTEEPDAP